MPFGTAKGKAEGVSECRRVIKDGQAWNRWQLPPAESEKYPAEGPSDPEFDVLAVIGKDGKYKAIVYNFACHAANTRDLTVSADYPGDVQQVVQTRLGYAVTTLFLTGACGDVNPVYGVKRDLFGETLGGAILRCLGQLEPIVRPSLAMESREIQMPGREHPELKEADIALKWPRQLEHYKKSFRDMKKTEEPSYPYIFSGIRIGDDFAIVTNPDELFCGFGISIKRQSPFKHTMVAEQTNGAWLRAHRQGVCRRQLRNLVRRALLPHHAGRRDHREGIARHPETIESPSENRDRHLNEGSQSRFSDRP